MNWNYQLTLSRDSIKFLKGQEKAIQQRIRKGLLGLTRRPPSGDIKPLRGKERLMRLRVGTFRIIFRVDHSKRMVYILTIDNRGDAYK